MRLVEAMVNAHITTEVKTAEMALKGKDRVRTTWKMNLKTSTRARA
jgi:hypothetical protein